MNAKSLMVLGTMSAVGKSLMVTGLCRLYARRGLDVAPFKAQNISNNAAVCADGTEIGRAQYTQALACGLAPEARMNPVLIKPEAGGRAQIIVMGRARYSLPAAEQQDPNHELWKVVTAAFDQLRTEHELLIIEGAGSPAEINLEADIVNMAVARYAQAPALLVGDIDRGGVFAQLLGTLWLLPPEDQALIKGLVVNKFRGQPEYFGRGIAQLEEKSGLPVIGVVPYIEHAIPEEDSVSIEGRLGPGNSSGDTEIVVLRLPSISNFDDFDALKAEAGVALRYTERPEQLGTARAVILPGSKSTMADMEWLVQRGWPAALRAFAGQGGAVVGICGGYQLLGDTILDPDGVESTNREVAGIGLLPLETAFQGEKATYQVRAEISGGPGWLAALQGGAVDGYEIHMGRTTLKAGEPWLRINRRGAQAVEVLDGAASPDGKVWGCYLHGLFNNINLRRAWLATLGWESQGAPEPASLEAALNRWADQVEAALDMSLLDQIIGL